MHNYNKTHTLIGVAQSVAFQRDFRFELLPAQIAQVTSLCVVAVHVGLQVALTAACVVTHAADVRLQTYSHRHTWTHKYNHTHLTGCLQLKKKSINSNS